MSRLCALRNWSNSGKQKRSEYVFLLLEAYWLNGRCFSKTLQNTEVRIASGFGWGLTKRIETYGITKFKQNLQRVSCSLHYSSCVD